MPLVAQRYPLVLNQGLDTKTDPKQVQGKLLLLENALFVSPGRLRKRNGYQTLSKQVLSSGSQILPSGTTVPSVLDQGWPKSAQTANSTTTTLTIPAPAPTAPGGPRLVYATISWRTHRDANGFFPDISNGTGVPVVISDSNGAKWVKIAEADFELGELNQFHHGCEIWAAWYPTQVPGGTLFEASFPVNPTSVHASTLFTVYSRYNTASGATGVRSCFGNVAVAHNVGGGVPGAETPIPGSFSVPLSVTDANSAAVFSAASSFNYATGAAPVGGGVLDASNSLITDLSTPASQVSGSVTFSGAGVQSVGMSGQAAWYNVAAAEILGSPGYTITNPTTNPPISSGTSILTVNDQLLVHDGESLYAWGAADNAWFPLRARGAGGFPALTVNTQSVIKNSGFQGHPDQTVHPNGYTCVAYEDTVSGGVHYTILDSQTGSPVFFDQPVVPINGISTLLTYAPKVISFGKWILLFYTSTANDPTASGSKLSLYMAAFDTTNPFNGFSATQLLHGNFPTDPSDHVYDVCVQGSYLCWAAASNTSNFIVVASAPLSATASAPAWSFATQTIVGPALGAIALFPDSDSSRIVLAWSDNASVKFAIYKADLTSLVQAATTVSTGSPAGSGEAACHLTGCSIPGDATNMQLWWTIPATPIGNAVPMNYRVRTSTVGVGYVPGTASTFLRSVGLVGKAFLMNGTRYVPVAFESTLQPTNFIADESGNVVAKVLPNVGIGQLYGATNGVNNRLLPESTVLNSTAYIAMQERFSTQGLSVQGTVQTGVNSSVTVTTSAGVTTVKLVFGQQFTQGALASTLHFGGGCLFMYDGAGVVEHGFHLFPEGVLTPSPGGPHVYQYVVCYGWMDTQGNMHRSAPSPAVQQAQANPIDAAAGACTIQIPTLRLTSKQAGNLIVSRRPVLCEVYRTQDLGSVFYRVGQTIQQTANDVTVDYINFTDTTKDSDLGVQLYTTGGVLENIACASPSYITMIENRLWVVDSTNGHRLWFSKEAVPGAPVEFNDGLVLNIEPRDRYGATGLVRLDDKTIVFRRNAISYIIGQGPDSTGGQNDFREIQLPSECGCSEPNSIIAAGDGILFKSYKGFFKLDRQLNTQYIGADVEAYNDSAVTSAVMLPRTNWALITLASGVFLLYDYLLGQWSVFPNLRAVDGGVYQNLHVWLDSQGGLHQETPGAFSDDGAYIPIRLSTSWVQLAGLQGFKRIWQLLILGDWFSPHQLQVDLAYDFDGQTIQQTDTYIATAPQTPLQFRVQTKIQQTQAIQVTLTEQPYGPNPVVGEGLALSSIAFDLGLKPGSFRLPASKTLG